MNMARNSPTSINVYNQCPRLYYHQFKEKRPPFPNIILIKGNAVHKALEEFFNDDPPLATNPMVWASKRLRRLFMKTWESHRQEVEQIGLPEQEIKNHYDECMAMLTHWLEKFLKRIDSTGQSFEEAFDALRPITEDECYLEKYEIRGFIDVVDKSDGDVKIIDYKTSSKFELTKEYKLQLAVYAYLYEQKHGKRPDKVGIYFLKERLHLISVDDAMIDFAEQQCKNIHEKTQSDDIKDYPQNSGYLCRMLKDKCPCHDYEDDDEE